MLGGGVSAYIMAQKYGTIKDKIFKGSHFGEKALTSNQKRSATIICNTDCELLVLRSEDYKNTIGKFESKSKSVLKIMDDYFPKIERITNLRIKESLMYIFDEMPLEIHTHPINEGEKSPYFYIIVNGVCEISKKLTVRVDPKRSFSNKDLKKHFRTKNVR